MKSNSKSRNETRIPKSRAAADDDTQLDLIPGASDARKEAAEAAQAEKDSAKQAKKAARQAAKESVKAAKAAEKEAKKIVKQTAKAAAAEKKAREDAAEAAAAAEERARRDAVLSKPTPDFASEEDLAAAIAGKCDLVEVGSDLLKHGCGEKGAGVQLRMWEAIVERLWGNKSSRADEPPEIEWDIPRPDRGSVQD
jgi:membrane protein involved in colicin uptake